VEDFVVVLLQLVLEFLFEVLWYVPWIAASRGEPSPEPWTPWKKGAAWFAIGAVLAWLSLLVRPRVIITDATLRIVNLVLAPDRVGRARAGPRGLAREAWCLDRPARALLAGVLVHAWLGGGAVRVRPAGMTG
jgi:hypothetical protein